MKKVLALLLVLMMTLSFALVSCDEKDDGDDTLNPPGAADIDDKDCLLYTSQPSAAA